MNILKIIALLLFIAIAAPIVTCMGVCGTAAVQVAIELEDNEVGSDGAVAHSQRTSDTSTPDKRPAKLQTQCGAQSIASSKDDWQDYVCRTRKSAGASWRKKCLRDGQYLELPEQTGCPKRQRCCP